MKNNKAVPKVATEEGHRDIKAKFNEIGNTKMQNIKINTTSSYKPPSNKF